MTASIVTQVVAICREVLEDPSVTLDSTTATVKNWDSLGHMRERISDYNVPLRTWITARQRRAGGTHPHGRGESRFAERIQSG